MDAEATKCSILALGEIVQLKFCPCYCHFPDWPLVARSRGFAQVIVLDDEFRLFKRAWCIAEIAVAAQGHIHQRLKAFSEDSLYRNYPEMKAFDVDTCEASHPPDKKMILDRINQHYKHLNDFNEVMFNIVHSMVDLKLKTLKIDEQKELIRQLQLTTQVQDSGRGERPQAERSC